MPQKMDKLGIAEDDRSNNTIYHLQFTIYY